MEKKRLVVVIVLIVVVIALGLIFHRVSTRRLQKEPITQEEPEKRAKEKEPKQNAPVSDYSIDHEARRFQEQISEADSLFQAQAYLLAKEAYLGALEIMEDPYPYQQIRKINDLMARQAQKKAKQDVAQAQEDRFTWVEGGRFIMPMRLTADSLVQRQVRVDGFYISKYEVTVAEYRRFCEATDSLMPAPPPWGWRDDHPMVNVSWHHANAYAQWAGKRLPTNAEWYFAASGGNQSEGYLYSGSDTLSHIAWFWNNSEEQIHPVGQKLPNELGLYDMSGNAWEWCSDWYSKTFLLTGTTDNPAGPADGEKRILRGGSWYSYPEYCALDYMSNGKPDYRYTHIGFRLAWDAR